MNGVYLAIFVLVPCFLVCESSVKVGRTVGTKATFSPLIHRPLKLPVWPVWGGVLAQCAGNNRDDDNNIMIVTMTIIIKTRLGWKY